MDAHPLLAASLDDPPPFPPNQTQLRRLDKSLICQICKEPFQGPVSIACGHSFCSQCIRSSLDAMKKCPSCGESAGEGSIRRNRALEEIVDAWEEARPVMIKLSLPQASSSRKRPGPEPSSRISPSGSHEAVKRLRRDSGQPSRSQSPAKSDSRIQREDSAAIEILNLEDVVADDVGDRPIEEELLNDDDDGECPICQARLPIASIPGHIERGCPPPKAKSNGSMNQKADWKKVFGGVGAKSKEAAFKRITKPNYNLATPSDLRNLLSTYGLQTTGDKSALEARVAEWILLYNSNMDTSHPRSLPALRAKLNEVENSRRRDKERGKEALVEQLGTAKGMAAYARDKKSEFERLKREAQRSRDQSRESGRGAERPIEVD